MPPVTLIELVYDLPTPPEFVNVPENAGADATVTLNDFESVVFLLSVTFRVNVNLPALVGLPASFTVVPESVSLKPVGSVPE